MKLVLLPSIASGCIKSLCKTFCTSHTLVRKELCDQRDRKRNETKTLLPHRGREASKPLQDLVLPLIFDTQDREKEN